MSSTIRTGSGRDIFPVYCRHCHKQISSSDRVCSHCGQSQGLMSQQAAQPVEPQVGAGVLPPVAAPAASASATQPQSQPSQFSNCPYCGTVVTEGDYYCRACGQPLVPGARGRRDDGSGLAYGISALTCAVLGFGPGALILGIVAMVKGSRAIGCAAILLGALVTVVLGLLAASSLKQFIPSVPAVPNPYRGLLP